MGGSSGSSSGRGEGRRSRDEETEDTGTGDIATGSAYAPQWWNDWREQYGQFGVLGPRMPAGSPAGYTPPNYGGGMMPISQAPSPAPSPDPATPPAADTGSVMDYASLPTNQGFIDWAKTDDGRDALRNVLYGGSLGFGGRYRDRIDGFGNPNSGGDMNFQGGWETGSEPKYYGHHWWKRGGR